MSFPERLKGLSRTERGATAGRYLLVSIVNLLAGQVLLAFFFGVVKWGAASSNVAATAIGLGPAYYFTRKWVWRQHGPSHMTREVLPFCVIVVLSLALTTACAALAQRAANVLADSRGIQTIVVMAGSLFGVAVAWVARFVILDRLIFSGTPYDLHDTLEVIEA